MSIAVSNAQCRAGLIAWFFRWLANWWRRALPFYLTQEECDGWWATVQQVVGKNIRASEKVLPEIWVEQPEYKIIEAKLVEILGHPYWLRKVARWSSTWRASFGKSETIEKMFVKTFIGKFLSSARLGIWSIMKGNDALNLNKMVSLVVDKPTRAVIKVEYRTDPETGITRTFAEDMYAILHWVVGMLQAIEQLWFARTWMFIRCAILAPLLDMAWKKRPVLKHIGRRYGHVRHLTLDIHPQEILDVENPRARLVVRADGCILINDEEFGKVVHLVRDPATGTYLGETTSVSSVDTIEAIVFDRNVTTQCKKTGWHLPIMEAGVAYRLSTPLDNLIELRWSSNIARWIGDHILRRIKKIDLGMTLEQSRAVAHARAKAEHEKAEAVSNVLASHAPTRKVLDQLLNDLNRRSPRTVFTTRSIVVKFDIVGFTNRADRTAPDVLCEEISVLLADLASVANRHGFWEYNRAGDAAQYIFSLDWPLYPDEAQKWSTLEAAAKAALQMTKELHLVALKRNCILRIGVSYDNIIWRDQMLPGSVTVKFHGIGHALNKAARMESYGAVPGTTAFTREFLAAAGFSDALFDDRPTPDLSSIGSSIGDDIIFMGDLNEKPPKKIRTWRRRDIDEETVKQMTSLVNGKHSD